MGNISFWNGRAVCGFHQLAIAMVLLYRRSVPAKREFEPQFQRERVLACLTIKPKRSAAYGILEDAVFGVIEAQYPVRFGRYRAT